MSVRISIDSSSSFLSSRKKSISAFINQVVSSVERDIDFGDVEIEIVETKNSAVLKNINGIGAYTPSEDFIRLTIDVVHPGMDEQLNTYLHIPLIHELHHCARRRAGVAIDGTTFGECIFSEGLADYFAYTKTGTLPPWIIDIHKQDKELLRKKIKGLYEKEFTLDDYTAWFIKGSEEKNIPAFAGYTLGFDMVKNLIEKNPQHTILSLTHTPFSMSFVKN